MAGLYWSGQLVILASHRAIRPTEASEKTVISVNRGLLRLLAGHLGAAVALLALDPRVLDGQAPDVEVIANGDNNIHHEAAVDTDSHAEHGKHEGNLVNTIAEGARPAEAKVALQDGTQRIADAKGERQAEDVRVGEVELDEVSRDHLTDRVGVYDAGEHDKRHEMGVQDGRVEKQVRDDEHPHAEEGEETQQRTAGAVAACAAGLDDVSRRLDGVEDEDEGALDHVPLGKGQLVEGSGDAQLLGDAKGAEHGLLPEGGAAHVAGQGVDADEDEDALDGTVDDAEGEGLCVVLVPGLNVKGEEGCGRRERIVLASCFRASRGSNIDRIRTRE